ncbi:MAG: toll/interleukin-1 receptor domain-containing protein [Pseudomonadota bacterium]|jgi:hypothetical protein|nr:MAG: hypothetical protein DIU62_04310 [Pseudomonadota bacterium]
MPDVFLSYCHDDQSAARRFAGALEDEGFEVWWDDVLNPGEAFDQVTEAALRAARAVVVLWTHRSVASRWVRSEATQAARYGTLVPVALEPCDRPIQFELTHTADLAGWNGDRSDARWRSFVERLRKFVARPDAGATGTAEVPAAPAPPSPPASTSRPSRSCLFARWQPPSRSSPSLPLPLRCFVIAPRVEASHNSRNWCAATTMEQPSAWRCRCANGRAWTRAIASGSYGTRSCCP